MFVVFEPNVWVKRRNLTASSSFSDTLIPGEFLEPLDCNGNGAKILENKVAEINVNKN